MICFKGIGFIELVGPTRSCQEAFATAHGCSGMNVFIPLPAVLQKSRRRQLGLQMQADDAQRE